MTAMTRTLQLVFAGLAILSGWMVGFNQTWFAQFDTPLAFLMWAAFLIGFVVFGTLAMIVRHR
jgi:hypothetical protein